MIKAPYDMVLVKVEHEKSKGVIILADSVGKQNRSYHGVVVDVGKDFHYEIKTGDKIIFPRGEGFPVTTEDGEELISLREQWVLGVIND